MFILLIILVGLWSLATFSHHSVTVRRHHSASESIKLEGLKSSHHRAGNVLFGHCKYANYKRKCLFAVSPYIKRKDKHSNNSQI